MNLLIIGAGGHGQVVRETAEAMECFSRIDFVDDNNEAAIGKMVDLPQLIEVYDSAFVGIGNNHLRGELIYKLEALGYHIPILIHPTAYVSKSSKSGPGTVIEPKAVVNANSVVGTGCIISVGAIVDHDTMIEDFVHVNAGAVVKAGSRVSVRTRIDAGEVLG